MQDLQSFVGRQETQIDVADGRRMALLAATLDHDQSPWRAGVLPPLGHWLCFQPLVRQSDIGPDGHPRLTETGLLPNAGLPRRMWAGSRIRFLRDIPLGCSMVRTSSVASVTQKTGRSGPMLFVTLIHRIACEDDSPAIVEEQDIVYREATAPGVSFTRQAPEAGGADPRVRHLTFDPVMLFRYSALTFNSHRIHYDRDYSRDVEGYPGLVVHGPLLATLLLNELLSHRPAGHLSAYTFKALSPVFECETVTLGSRETDGGAALRAIGPAGVAMTAVAQLTT